MLLSKKEFSNDLVFPNTKGIQMDASQPIKALKRAFKKVQSSLEPNDFKGIKRWQELIQKMRFHDLRVTGGSIMHKNGVPIKVISELMGHASVQITYDLYVTTDEAQHTDGLQVVDKAIASRFSVHSAG